MESIKIVIADDDEDMRHALTSMLHSDPRFDVVGHADSGQTLVEVTALTRPHVALVDVRMPGGGAEAVRAVTTAHPTVVVVVSAEPGPRTVAEMVRAGARGYLLKGNLGSSLPDLVARCVAGEVVLAVPTGAEALRQIMGRPLRR